MYKKSLERGAISVAVAVLILVTSLVGIVAGYKAVQSPTRTLPKAQQLKCTDLTQYPKRNCAVTLDGPCNYGEWKYDCKTNSCPYDSSAGVGVPYWCDGDKWYMMNYEGECTNQCQPSSVQPTATPGGGDQAGACFRLNVDFNYVPADNNFDHEVTFTNLKPFGFHIQLYRNGSHVAGMNNLGSVFTYFPGASGYNYSRIPANASTSFRGWGDCPGNYEATIACTTSVVNSQPSVSGSNCSCRNCGQAPPPTQIPAATATPTRPAGGVGATNTPVPPTSSPTPTNTPSPTPSNTPTPTIPPDATCGYPNLDCCLPPQTTPCLRGSECSSSNPSVGICGPYPTSTPTRTPTPTLEPYTPQAGEPVQQENFVQRVINNIPFIPKAQPTTEQKPTSISGKMKVNNTTGAQVEAVFVTLHTDKNDRVGISYIPVQNETYNFDGLEDKPYVIKAWARTADGRWYQNKLCGFVSDECSVKPGETKTLTIDIGEQGLRYFLTKTQEFTLKSVGSIRNIPVIGPFLEIFVISAF